MCLPTARSVRICRTAEFLRAMIFRVAGDPVAATRVFGRRTILSEKQTQELRSRLVGTAKVPDKKRCEAVLGRSGMNAALQSDGAWQTFC